MAHTVAQGMSPAAAARELDHLCADEDGEDQHDRAVTDHAMTLTLRMERSRHFSRSMRAQASVTPGVCVVYVSFSFNCCLA
jgi:hypothetical protein